MNGIAQNIVPSDEQLRCEHFIGWYSCSPCLLTTGHEYLLDSDYATKFQFCPKCGARLIEREGQGREKSNG